MTLSNRAFLLLSLVCAVLAGLLFILEQMVGGG